MVTKDDIETMRILFGADINELCNQGRWKDAKEMEQIRDRLMEALKDRPTGEVLEDIKAEIADIYCGAYCDNPYTAGKVREQALDIIDKHITKT